MMTEFYWNFCYGEPSHALTHCRIPDTDNKTVLSQLTRHRPGHNDPSEKSPKARAVSQNGLTQGCPLTLQLSHILQDNTHNKILKKATFYYVVKKCLKVYLKILVYTELVHVNVFENIAYPDSKLLLILKISK